MVEGLGSSDLNCSHFELEHSGFKILCDEGIRYTHAFTTSVLTQAAVGSLFTGLWPKDSGLRDNASTYLSAEIETNIEVALKNGYRTSFFVSSPSIKRVSRLHQGFEFYSDYFLLGPLVFYQSADKVFQDAFDWLTSVGSSRPILQVLHLSDLTYNSNSGSNLEDIDDALYGYLNNLRNAELWNNSYVVLVGLQGPMKSERKGEIHGSNLFSERTQVPLIIKPPQSLSVSSKEWKIDSNVSLIDVGATLYSIFKKSNVISSAETSAIDLQKTFTENYFIPSERILLIESYWPKWVGLGEPRYALRMQEWMMLLDQTAPIYNSVSDREELSSIDTNDAAVVGFQLRAREFIETNDLKSWIRPSESLISEISFWEKALIDPAFENKEYRSELLKNFFATFENPNYSFPIANFLIRDAHWSQINTYNQFWNNSLLTDFIKINSGQPQMGVFDPCLNFYLHKMLDPKRKCIDSDVLSFVSLITSSEDNNASFDKFVSNYRWHYAKRNLRMLDYEFGGTLLGFSDKQESIGLVDVLLALPKYKKISLKLEKRFR
jgi:hypothetical protein